MQVGGFASMLAQALSRATPSTALKLIFLFMISLLDGIKTVPSGQGVIPIKSGVGPRGVPQGRNLFEPRM
jgi:hypothetical protein